MKTPVRATIDYGEPNGPFATEAEAIADARFDAEIDAQAEEIMSHDPQWTSPRLMRGGVK